MAVVPHCTALHTAFTCSRPVCSPNPHSVPHDTQKSREAEQRRKEREEQQQTRTAAAAAAGVCTFQLLVMASFPQLVVFTISRSVRGEYEVTAETTTGWSSMDAQTDPETVRVQQIEWSSSAFASKCSGDPSPMRIDTWILPCLFVAPLRVLSSSAHDPWIPHVFLGSLSS